MLRQIASILILIFVFFPHNLYAQYSAGANQPPPAQPVDKYKSYVDERKLNVYRSYGFRDWYTELSLGYVVTPKIKMKIQGRDTSLKQSNGINLNIQGGFHINRWFSFGLSADLQRSAATVVPDNLTDKVGNLDTQRFSMGPVLTFWPVGSDQKIYLPYIGLGLGQQFAKSTFGPNPGNGFNIETFGQSGLMMKMQWGIDFSLDSSMRVGMRHEHQFLDILNDSKNQIDIFSIHAGADF